MIAARHKENEYFASSPDYGHLASKMGYEYLAKLLSKHLESVIRACIPSSISLINKNIDELESEMDHLGRPIARVYKFCGFCQACDRTYKEHLERGRPGGDRVCEVLDNQLPADIKKLPFDQYLSLKNVKMVVLEEDGYQPHLISPEKAYRRLIKGALQYYKGPAKTSVEAVHNILKELVRESLTEIQELKHFPTLQVKLEATANEFLQRSRDESMKTTLRLVVMEAAYLIVDFFQKLPHDVGERWNSVASTMDRYSEGYIRRIGSNVSAYINMVSERLKISIPIAVVYCHVQEATKQSLLNQFYEQMKEGKPILQCLDEDPTLMEKRRQCAKSLELHKAAKDEIDSMSWDRCDVELKTYRKRAKKAVA